MKKENIKYPSFGNFPKLNPNEIKFLNWRHITPDFDTFSGKFLPRGFGKSYGDSCLLQNGILLDTTQMNKIISFDPDTGIIRAESGVSFSQLLDFLVPRGYFLPVTPGTKHISLAGAIANDVHGKNHFSAGNFGNHIIKFELIRSDGRKLICSEDENQDYFSATIGGLGLTGIITWAEFKAKISPSPYFYVENIKFKNIDEFFEINKKSEENFPYTVAWIDCTAKGKHLGRGIYNRGRHADFSKDKIPQKSPKDGAKPFPFELALINKTTTKIFNILWYNKQIRKKTKVITHYNPFFYPLDGVDGWNKAYGKNGFLQYQFVVPMESGKETVRNILNKISTSGLSSFLVVLKTFGYIPAKGMLSFPKRGITLAVDFAVNKKSLKLCNELDILVNKAGGRLYPAKDSRMSGADFKKYYPNYEEFSKFIDPKITSSFWQRIINNEK